MKALYIEAGLIVGACILFAGCGRSPRPQKAARFTHTTHLSSGVTLPDGEGSRALVCTDCHALSAETRWVSARPGAAQHAPCDVCHQREFSAPPGPLCEVCHVTVDPLQAGRSELAAYPPFVARAELIGRFGHALHLGPDVQLDGRPMACEDCHRVADESAAFASFPIHADCAECHAPGAPAAERVSMEQCTGCHRAAGPGRLRNFARNDVRFTHGKHQADQAGNPIPCERCHAAVVESPDGDTFVPAMATCATCHEDSTKTPDRVRIENCGVCHIGDVRSRPLPGNHTAALAPALDGALGRRDAHATERPVAVLAQARSEGDGPATDAIPRLVDLLPSPFDPYVAREPTTPPPRPGAPRRRPAELPRADDRLFRSPDDHTPLFRTRHGAAAASPDARCGYCHGEVSGGRDACQDCHAVMRPDSHTLHFRNATHGRIAARDPRACATCHEVDYCAACHSVPPPSHRGDFARDHRRVAAFNARSCLTCHSFEGTCIECHVSQTPRIGIDPQDLRRRGR
ncbi:MAG: hypothetical protein H6701_13035 [Myxococcales bacterium]|nr:hypothetical protein [Myxococcales bacterium]